ncbi:glycosyltransferase family 2 protein [Flavobacterium sp. 7A]|uniref:glycosyltransferase family 2 protein n=1 Tax=Flavobacterium sp. 7A TaxID=2940571 RepID=UPI002227A174|nr:glycosyltransferase family A protein [Flavobacterium sp. 7A]MCW2119435.1 glycosyltransferase involved in cell wall biosynthesis [Flavobacterium sp. 7A]
MNTKSNVTVVIPCYNDGKYIAEALQSIYNQTLLPEKIIIVDDGSGMETQKMLAKINHPLLQIIRQENQGVSVARNSAIAIAQTDFIVNLDADDYYESTFIEKAVAILDGDSKIGMVSSFCRAFINSKTLEIIKPLGGTVTDFIVVNNGRASAMFRKSCWEKVGGFDEKMISGYEDWEFWIAVTKNSWSMSIIPEVLSHYRIKKSSRDRTAIINHDFELRNYIFNKHRDVYISNFEFYCGELLRQNSLLRISLKNAKESKEYVLGKKLLAPIRFFKKIVFK